MSVVCREATTRQWWEDKVLARPKVRCRLVPDTENGLACYFLYLSIVLPCIQGDTPEIVEFCRQVEIFPASDDEKISINSQLMIGQIHLDRAYRSFGFPVPPPPISERDWFWTNTPSRCRGTSVEVGRTYRRKIRRHSHEYITRDWRDELLYQLVWMAQVDIRLIVAKCFAKFGISVHTDRIYQGWPWDYYFTEGESLLE